MAKKHAYAIVGGDLRNAKLAESIKSDQNTVSIFGFGDAKFETVITESGSLEIALSDADVVVGPLPLSNDSQTINAPFYPGKIYVNEILKTLTPKQLFVAGRIDESIRNNANALGINTVDILSREEMAVLNAIPIVLSKEV